MTSEIYSHKGWQKSHPNGCQKAGFPGVFKLPPPAHVCAHHEQNTWEKLNARNSRPFHSGPHQRPPGGAPRDGHLDGGPARAGSSRLHPAALRRREEGVQDRRCPGLPVPGIGHRRLGSGDDQHPVARRQGADRPLRPVLAAVGRHVHAHGPRGRRRRRAVGRGRSGRDLCREAQGRQGAQLQGRARHPQ